MREKVEAKKKQAEEQIAIWQQQYNQAQVALAQAQDNLSRWSGVLGACNELLGEEKEEPPPEEEAAD